MLHELEASLLNAAATLRAVIHEQHEAYRVTNFGCVEYADG